MIKRFADILAERVTRTSRTDSPPTSIVRVAPQEITHRPFVGHFLDAVECPHVVEGVDGRGKTAVETEDLVVD